jgi:phosphatidylserine/phosphatidylglycerophosphate/cardiolipin synthase-like enzyme
MTNTYRRIFKSQVTGSETIRELLQSMFVGEMLQPGGSICIASPWVSNIVLIDNRSGAFDSLNPEWGRRELRLTDILITLMTRCTQVAVITRRQESNAAFLNELNDLTARYGLESSVTVTIRETLHTKGLLLSQSLLLGSMNLTYSGLTINDEWIEFSLDPEDVARTKLEFAQYRAT